MHEVLYRRELGEPPPCFDFSSARLALNSASSSIASASQPRRVSSTSPPKAFHEIPWSPRPLPVRDRDEGEALAAQQRRFNSVFPLGVRPSMKWLGPSTSKDTFTPPTVATRSSSIPCGVRTSSSSGASAAPEAGTSAWKSDSLSGPSTPNDSRQSAANPAKKPSRRPAPRATDSRREAGCGGAATRARSRRREPTRRRHAAQRVTRRQRACRRPRPPPQTPTPGWRCFAAPPCALSLPVGASLPAAAALRARRVRRAKRRRGRRRQTPTPPARGPAC